MNGIGISSRTNRNEYPQNHWPGNGSPSAKTGGFAQAMTEAQLGSGDKSQAHAGSPSVRGTYNSGARLDGQTAASPSDSLVASVTQAVDEGRTLSDETMAKLYSDNPNEFLEAMGEITGKSPAQIMAALLTMNGTQVHELAVQLEKLTGGAPTAMLSRLTGTPEAMLQQVLNNSGDEEEEKDGEKTQSVGLDRQLRGQSMLKNIQTSVNAMV